MEKLMVYVPVLSNRADYILTLMIRDLIGVEMIVTDHREDYHSYPGPRLEYSSEASGEGVFVCACGLLEEKSVLPQSPGLFTFENYPAFFPVSNENSAFPFDLFAASFYLVTRYEEYLSFIPDHYGRFRASDSIATAGKFLDLPIVNIWAGFLKDRLKAEFPLLQFREKKFRFIPTIDIDHAYAFKQRNFMRTLGGYGRSVMKLNLEKVAERTNVLMGIRKDPYDQYDYIRKIHARQELNPLWFILFADYGKDDNNVTLSGRNFHRLLRDLDDSGTLGIHPSLTSGRHPKVLHSEIRNLSKVLGHEIVASRQHFLKVSFPGTYRNLIKNGITDDYSLGYASSPGFRAGIANPFPFFDLAGNKAENFTVHPVSLMDVTLKDYCKIAPEEAIALGRSFADKIKAVEGEFVSVWHNESFDETGRWKGWRKVYEDLLSYARSLMKTE
jgi:hypothetical protein